MDTRSFLVQDPLFAPMYLKVKEGGNISMKKCGIMLDIVDLISCDIV